MKCDIERGINFAMIHVAGVGILNIIALMICGFFILMVLHAVAFSSLFPADTSYQITNYYGKVERMNTTPTPSAYPLLLCLFVDSMIIMGICGACKVDLPKALMITLCVFTAPLSIPILLFLYHSEKPQASSENDSSFVEETAETKREPIIFHDLMSLNPKHKKRHNQPHPSTTDGD